MRRGPRSGTAAAEFALVLLPLLLLIFGVLEFARLLWTRTALQQTAIATARCMGVRQASCATSGAIDPTKAILFARQRASSFSVALPTSAVSAVAATTCAGQGGFSVVTISTIFTTGVPLLRQALGTTTPISTTACFPNQF